MNKLLKESDIKDFEKIKNLVTKFLKRQKNLPFQEYICGFDVSLMEQDLESLFITIYLDDKIRNFRPFHEVDDIVDNVWELVFNYFGVTTYLKRTYLPNCKKENIVESNEKLDKKITEYFYKLFNVAEINWRHPYEMDNDADEYTEYIDGTRTIFYYGNEFDDDVVFRYYDKGYFHTGTDADENSPILSIEDNYKSVLDGYFGDLWHEPFKKWFKENFGMYVKTVDYL